MLAAVLPGGNGLSQRMLRQTLKQNPSLAVSGAPPAPDCRGVLPCCRRANLTKPLPLLGCKFIHVQLGMSSSIDAGTDLSGNRLVSVEADG